ncbi:MAG: hypothetical protein CMC70_09365 [Flavobacteriaceae bacterium]|mgnify:FL=1|nr:hypothetical protein [Flavobacteriaceae bacterium]
MNFFYKYTVEDFDNLHNQVYQNQSESSKRTFKSTLKRIEKVYGKPLNELELEFCKDPVRLHICFQGTNYKENTFFQTISCCIKILKMIDAPLGLINKYIKYHKTQADKVQTEKIKTFQNTDLKVEFTDLKQTLIDYIETENLYELNYKDFISLLILSLFILIIPSRSSNYMNMKIYTGSNLPDDDSHNYLINDKKKKEYSFVFNNSRKNTVLPKRILPITNNKLAKLIDIYLNDYYKDNKTRWFLKRNISPFGEYKNIEIQRAVIYSSENIFGFSVNINDIRKLYLKHIYKLDVNLLDHFELIYILGYKSLPAMLKKN